MPQYFTRDYFTYDGKPSFIFGGDFNYTRCRADDWRDRMLKMRAAGLNTLNLYATWAFHELAEGEWDFSGDRDLARYLDTAQELGLWVVFRLGPFIHGEWRNGGLPQWLLDKLGKRARSNDPEYLRLAKLWYEKELEIAVPRLISRGGPIIMVQVENELGSAGSKGDDIPRGSTDPEENAKHVLYFHGLLQEHGVDVPVLDINHFPGKEDMPNLISPGGAYIVNCFGSEGDFWPLSLDGWDRHDRPLMTIETMGGMFQRFYDWPAYQNTNGYQGPIVKPEYLEAVTHQHLAEGSNAINYYVFVDGQHPDEGNERMLPYRDMNYQAPITATGTLRESYRSVKRLGWFLRAFEQEMLTSQPNPTWMHAVSYGQAHPGTEETGDLFAMYHAEGKEIPDALKHVSVLKASGRATKGLNLSESNFAFLFNISTRGTQWKCDVRLTTSPRGIPCEVSAEYPRRTQLSLPPQRTKCLPFFVKLTEGTFLEYSTAELLDRRPFGAGVQVILHADADELVETRLVLPERREARHDGASLALWESPNTLLLAGVPGENLSVVTVGEAEPVRIVLMERRLAGQVWDLAAPGGPVVAASNLAILESTVSGSQTVATVQLTEPDVFLHLICDREPVVGLPQVELTGGWDPATGVYSASGRAAVPPVEIPFTQRREGELWVWEAEVRPEQLAGLAELILHAEYDGDCARAYLDETLISDHYMGRWQYWEAGLKNWLTAPATLRLEFERTRQVDLRVMPVVETEMRVEWK
ncbi:MAG TPA: beta-galactosidase [Armatimonadota bacterium]|jgi:hypothetical protein